MSSGIFSDLFGRFFEWAVGTEGSSRSSALIRIGLGFLIWARFAADQLLFKHDFGWQTLFSLAFYLFTLLMVLGIYSQVSTFAVGILTLSFYFYFGLVADIEPYTHHHTYWLGIATLFCALTPCGKSFSFDRWHAVRSARLNNVQPPAEAGNLWGLRLIVIQLSLMYFWSAFDKSHFGFLDGDRLEAIFMNYYIGSNLDLWESWLWIFAAAAWFVVIIEYALAFGLPFEKTRRYLIVPGLLLHLAFYVMLPVLTYSATIILLYLAYLDADKVHRFIDELMSPQRQSH